LINTDKYRALNLFDEAINLARNAQDEYYQTRALAEIASKLVKVDMDRALNLLESIDDKYVKAKVLSTIAIELAKMSTKRALDHVPRDILIRIIREKWDKDEIRELLKNIEQVAKIQNKLNEYRKILEKAGVSFDIPQVNTMKLSYWIERTQELMEKMEKKIGEYREMVDEWQRISERYEGMGIEISDMPVDYYELKKKLEELKRINFSASVQVNFIGEVNLGMWSKGEIEVKNSGEINLEDLKVEINSRVVEVEGLKRIGILRRGESRKIPVRIKSKDAGYVPVEIKIKYRNPLSEKEEESVIYPEIYVKEEAREKVMAAATVAAAGERHIPLSKVKEMYGIKEEEEYEWGEFESYDILRMIGGGGFSVVYEVKRGRKRYAMKIPKGVDWKMSETLVLRDVDLEQYRKEAIIWAMLTEKVPDGVIHLIDAGIRPFPWFVMEIAENSLVEVYKGMSYEERIKVAVDLLDKLDRIHRLNVVHKDIKPENILYAGGEWKFTDFGLSKIVKRSSKSSQMLSGTLLYMALYMAPEQISKKKFGHTDWRTDIWQIGVMIYELLTGHLPFEAEDAWEITGMILRDEPIPATEYGLSKEVWRVIEKALRKDKEERWQSAAEMKRGLEGLL